MELVDLALNDGERNNIDGKDEEYEGEQNQRHGRELDLLTQRIGASQNFFPKLQQNEDLTKGDQAGKNPQEKLSAA